MNQQQAVHLDKLIRDERHLSAQSATSINFVAHQYDDMTAADIEKFRGDWCRNIEAQIAILRHAARICAATKGSE